MSFISYLFRRFKWAGTGIITALRTDSSFRLQALGGLFLALFAYYFWPLTQVEILFLGLGWALVLITELQNSSFENALDHLHPDLHHNIGKSKDMAAGSVFIAGLFLLFVMITIVVV